MVDWILILRKSRVTLKKENTASLADGTLPEWELAVLDVFVRAAAMFGLRKSVALVYGALYCSLEALSVQELQAKLSLSRGAVVEAIQLLRRLGAVRVHLKIGERRDYFTAETDLKQFAGGFLKEVLAPALEKADIRLAQAEAASRNSGSEADSAFARARIAELTLWKSRFTACLPLVENFLGK